MTKYIATVAGVATVSDRFKEICENLLGEDWDTLRNRLNQKFPDNKNRKHSPYVTSAERGSGLTGKELKRGGGKCG